MFGGSHGSGWMGGTEEGKQEFRAEDGGQDEGAVKEMDRVGHIQGRFWSRRHQELRARRGEEREGGLKGELEPRSPLPGVRLSRQARDLSLGVQPTFCRREELDFAKTGEAFCYTTSVSWNNRLQGIVQETQRDAGHDAL